MDNNKEQKGKEVDIMATIKPIQATPELSGKDAINLLLQTNTRPTEKAMKKIRCCIVSLPIYVKYELSDRK